MANLCASGCKDSSIKLSPLIVTPRGIRVSSLLTIFPLLSSIWTNPFFVPVFSIYSYPELLTGMTDNRKARRSDVLPDAFGASTTFNPVLRLIVESASPPMFCVIIEKSSNRFFVCVAIWSPF